MKNAITFLFILFAINSAFATVRTVSNDPIGGAQYSNLQAAYNAAANGDTLLIEGTNIVYTFTNCSYWQKSLTLIGSGYNTQKQFYRRTQINGIPCTALFDLGASASGSRFYGIEFTVWARIRETVSNVLFEDCKFDQGFSFVNNTASNFTFRNCQFDWDGNYAVLAEGSGVVISNVLITNCIIDGFIDGTSNPYFNPMIDHCVFLTPGSTFINLYNATVMNCIFMNSFPSGIGSSTFLNNMCRVAGTFPPTALGGNTGSGNLNATNPNFVSYSLGSYYSTSHNYHLQAGSPALGAASDGTEIGAHGGTTKYNESGEVLIVPVMRSVNITNPTISPNGTLSVNINSSKPSDN